MLSLIVAFDRNRLIGKDNAMPWHLPKDLKYFKAKTLNHKVVMGYNTYMSILECLNHPFPNRHNIILSHESFDPKFDNVSVLTDINKVIEYKSADEEVFIAGGKSIYEQLISHCDRLYITHIDDEYEGDTQFPEFDFNEFELVSEDVIDNLNFSVYERKKNV